MFYPVLILKLLLFSLSSASSSSLRAFPVTIDNLQLSGPNSTVTDGPITGIDFQIVTYAAETIFCSRHDRGWAMKGLEAGSFCGQTPYGFALHSDERDLFLRVFVAKCLPHVDGRSGVRYCARRGFAWSEHKLSTACQDQSQACMQLRSFILPLDREVPAEPWYLDLVGRGGYRLPDSEHTLSPYTCPSQC